MPFGGAARDELPSSEKPPQLAGPKNAKMGMNNPDAKQNYRFALNVVHWLSGLMQTR
jgi:hypothetical protein